MAMHDHVDHAVLEQIFGALESFRQTLADRLRDDALAGETDLRAGLGDLDVAQHRVGRADAAIGRIGEHDDVRQPRLVQHVDADRHARHLHQRENSLLHARAAGRDEENERPLFGDRGLHRDAPAPSPTPMTSEPPRKSNGCTAIITGMPSSVPRAAESASLRPVLARERPSARRRSASRRGTSADRLGTSGDGRFSKRRRVEDRGETLGRPDAHVKAALRADILRRARSRWKIISPQDGHFFQRFSGVSARASRPSGS